MKGYEISPADPGRDTSESANQRGAAGKRVWRVLKSNHVHVGGRGGAFMQVEMKDIEQGTKTNQRFRTEDKVERAFVDPRDMQYLYQDGDSYVFMDKENYEQLSLPADFLERLVQHGTGATPATVFRSCRRDSPTTSRRFRARTAARICVESVRWRPRCFNDGFPSLRPRRRWTPGRGWAAGR